MNSYGWHHNDESGKSSPIDHRHTGLCVHWTQGALVFIDECLDYGSYRFVVSNEGIDKNCTSWTHVSMPVNVSGLLSKSYWEIMLSVFDKNERVLRFWNFNPFGYQSDLYGLLGQHRPRIAMEVEKVVLQETAQTEYTRLRIPEKCSPGRRKLYDTYGYTTRNITVSIRDHIARIEKSLTQYGVYKNG